MVEKNHPLAVLVMDLDSRTLELTTQHLEYRIEGMTVLRASSYREARYLAKSQHPRFCVIDCDGLEHERASLLETVARSCPQAKVVLTTRASALKLDLANVVGVLIKPYRIDDLIDLVRKAQTRKRIPERGELKLDPEIRLPRGQDT